MVKSFPAFLLQENTLIEEEGGGQAQLYIVISLLILFQIYSTVFL